MDPISPSFLYFILWNSCDWLIRLHKNQVPTHKSARNVCNEVLRFANLSSKNAEKKNETICYITAIRIAEFSCSICANPKKKYFKTETFLIGMREWFFFMWITFELYFIELFHDEFLHHHYMQSFLAQYRFHIFRFFEKFVIFFFMKS